MNRTIKRIAAAAATAASSFLTIAGLATAASAAPQPAPVVPQQFTITVQADHRLLTSAHLFTGEVLRVGLDGQSFTITSEQFNGGGTVAWTAQAFPKYLISKTFLVTAG